jgi:hypothetical protein
MGDVDHGDGFVPTVAQQSLAAVQYGVALGALSLFQKGLAQLRDSSERRLQCSGHKGWSFPTARRYEARLVQYSARLSMVCPRVSWRSTSASRRSENGAMPFL